MKKKNILTYHIVSSLLFAASVVAVFATQLPYILPIDDLLLYHSSDVAKLIVCVSLLLIGIYALIKPFLFRASLPVVVLLADSILLTYIFCELFATGLFYKPHTDSYLVSNNIVIPDSVTGYKMIPGFHRHAYVFGGQVVFDSRFRANNAGYPAQTDFLKIKQAGKRRFMVLGDSFTSTSFNGINWVDMLNSKTDSVGMPVEFYSFSLEGIGVPAWHNIFFKEILNQYDFDAVILPIYFEDIFRRQVVFYEANNRVNCIYADTIPENLSLDNLLSNFNSGTIAITDTEQGLDKWISTCSHTGKFSQNPSLYLLNKRVTPLLTRAVYYTLKIVNKHSDSLTVQDAITFFKGNPPAYENFQKIGEILEACKKMNKELIICSIPDYQVADTKVSVTSLHEENFIHAVAEHFGVPYFSGFRSFEALNYESTGKYFIADGHWNRAGSSLFADAFYLYLSQHKFLITEARDTSQQQK